jgi:hypothetical protein
MKQTLCILVLMSWASWGLGAEVPALSVSTNTVAPPEFRSYKHTITFTRGKNVILLDIVHGPAVAKSQRMQHVMHDGAIVYTIRYLARGHTKHFKSKVVSVQEDDINGDGKTDLLFLMHLGNNRIIEAFKVTGGKTLTPLPSEDLFDKNGKKRSYRELISRIEDKISQQPLPHIQK